MVACINRSLVQRLVALHGGSVAAQRYGQGTGSTFIARFPLALSQLVGRQIVDVVLLDIGLPKLNGYDVSRRLRQQIWSKGLFIIALTGWGQVDDRRQSAEAGFDSHLVKPLTLAALKTTDHIRCDHGLTRQAARRHRCRNGARSKS